MAITEGNRHQLYLRLEEVLGPEEATTLMEHLPPAGWADVTTKTDLEGTRALLHADLDRTRAELTAEIGQVRTELTAEIGHVRTELTAEIGHVRTELTAEIGHVRTELTAEIGHVRTELTAEIGQVRTELRAEIALVRSEVTQLENRVDAKLERGFREQTRTLVLANLGGTLALGSLILAAVRL